MSNDGVNQGRRRVLTAMTSVIGAAGVVGAAVPYIGSWSPSAKAKAAGAPVKVNVGKLEQGQMVTVEWRGKPVYVFRRSEAAVEKLKEVEGRLRDPGSAESEQPAFADNFYRSERKEISVLLGVCTHLGCAPAYRPDVNAQDVGDDNWIGGFFCKCHGSKFDLAGRVFTGVPAPKNLPVPPYQFLSDDVILIGAEQEA